MKGDKNMDYKTMRDKIEDMVNDNHKNFVKGGYQHGKRYQR